MLLASLVPADFARTGLHFAPSGVNPTRFQVIGERSSGTNHVKRLLGRNTPLIPVELLGWKHGGIQAQAVPRDMVVVLSLRNAVDWALSMYAKPWHTPPTMQQLEFADFLRTPWETILDHPKYFEGAGPLMVGQPLQQDRDPMGRPYPNLFALRVGKLAAHLSWLNRGCSVVVVRHESVLADQEGFVQKFRSQMGLPPLDAPLRPVVKRLGSRFVAAVSGRPDAPKEITDGDRAFLRAQLDLPLEKALGYDY
ncbi:hypothetical protein [Thalassovita sp.]|uniref:hypothetical protein n=1 Tax=Thalassovita sp. TaxID=1979401 RepID=UPI003B5910FF